MDIIELLKYAKTNLLMRKTRTFLTLLSIFVGITTIFIFISFGLGLFSYIEEIAGESSLDKFIVQARGVGAPGLDQTFALDETDLEEVEKTLGVKKTLGFYADVAEVEHKREKKFVFVSSWDPTATNNQLIEEAFGVSVYPGRSLRKGDTGKVVLGHNYQLPNKIFEDTLKIGGKITINDEDFSIVGFFELVGNPQDDSNVYISEEDYKRLIGADEKFAMIFGQVHNPEEVNLVVDRIQKNIRKNRGLEEGKEDFFVQTYEELIAQFGAVLNIVIGFVIIIALISVLVSAVNTANTMVTSVLERTKEIGIMKAIGATRSMIRNMFLIESGLVGLIAGLFGVIVGWAISALAGLVLSALGWNFLAPQFTLSLFISLILFSTVVGVVSGVTVAIKASLLKPVDALRYE
jgi:putative ABC transport system permease protein|tara:strand:+ start:104 stop:1321 length:1218 start_codon:yes stop_codon:yes gene_type:complete